MYWYQYLSLVCLFICIVACFWHFFRLIRLGKPKDLSRKSGNIFNAERYSYTKAMLPSNKESAFMHIPTFTLGILFHIGTFLSLLLFLVFFFVNPVKFPDWLNITLVILLAISVLSGLSLLFKRLFVKKLRELSSPDDFISNFVTTFFQISTLFYIIYGNCWEVGYYIVASLLLLYIPIGKLRHVVYFFAARYHLGFFYGWRNSWPPQNCN